MSSKYIETEIKFRIKNEDEVIRRLESIGAKKVSGGLEHNEGFDNGSLRERGVLLRLRKFNGKNILTFKIGITKEKFKKAEEIETGVSDFQKAKTILRNLGFEVSWIYEKKRTLYALGNTTISIDIFPFGSFIEIEGSESGIREVAKGLNMDIKKGITKTYLEIYEDLCREKGREVENLVYWRKAG